VLSAALQALLRTSFTVFGAPIPHDSALVSVGAELIVAELVRAGQIRRRVGGHRADLRRHGDAQIYAVSENSRTCSWGISAPGKQSCNAYRPAWAQTDEFLAASFSPVNPE